MDKNKKKADMLAAGRKKLQQFRQKKDNKGGKGSSERNDDGGSMKGRKGKQATREDEDVGRSELDSRGKGLGDGNNVVDQAPEADSAETTAVKTAGFSEEGSSVGETELHADVRSSSLQQTSFIQETDYNVVDAVGDQAPEAATAGVSEEGSSVGEAELHADVRSSSLVQSSSIQETDYIVVEEVVQSSEVGVSGVEEAKEQFADSFTSVDSQFRVHGQYPDRQNAEGLGLIQDDETVDTVKLEDGKLSSSESDVPLIVSSETMGDQSEALVKKPSIGYPHDTYMSADYDRGDSEEVQMEGKGVDTQGFSESNSHKSEEVPLNEINKFPSKLDVEKMESLLERLKEQLYLTMLVKETAHLELTEQTDMHSELLQQSERSSDKLFSATTSLDEVNVKNENLVKEVAQYKYQLEESLSMREGLYEELYGSKAEVEKSSARVHQLLNELEISQGDLSRLSSELVECRNSMVACQTENETLRQSLHLETTEKEQIVVQKTNTILENEKLATELTKCKDSLVFLQSENANMTELVAQAEGTNSKLSSENELLLSQNAKLVTELRECKNMLPSLQLENEKLASELTKCKDSLLFLQSENANMTELVAQAEGTNSKISSEIELLLSQNAKLVVELRECKDMLPSLQLENEHLNASILGERKKIEHEKDCLLKESEEITLESIKCMVLVEAMQMEIISYKSSLVPVADDRSRLEKEKMLFLTENEKLSCELINCKALVENLQAEFSKGADDSKQATLHIEQLVEENFHLNSNLEIQKDKMRELEDLQMRSSRVEKLGDQVEGSRLLLEFHDGSLVLESLEKQIKEATDIMQKLQKAIEWMHFHSASVSTSSREAVSPGVSKLIQAFEIKECADDHVAEKLPSSGSQLTEDPYDVSIEHMRNLGKVLQKLLLDAADAAKVLKEERNHSIISNDGVAVFHASDESLKEPKDSVEEANLECMIILEALRQHVVEANMKGSELVGLYEASHKKAVNLRAENSAITLKICDFEAKLSKQQSQLNETYQSSLEMLSSFSSQVEELNEVVVSREVVLKEEWNSVAMQIVQMLDKLNSSSSMSSSNSLSCSSDITGYVAASVDAATNIIEDLEGQLEAAKKDHEHVRSTYNEVNEEFNGLQEQHKMAFTMLHKIYSDLVRLVNKSCGSIEENESGTVEERLLDPRTPGGFDTLINQIEALLSERLMLKNENSRLSSELTARTNDVDEISSNSVGSDAILILIEKVYQEIRLEGFDSQATEPLQHLESLIYLLVQKYKEADERGNLSREMYASKCIELSDLHGQIDQLSFSLIQHENEIVVLKESLNDSKDSVGSIRSELLGKIAGLEQSEQRVSSLREKLGIAVTKGKGLIVQRDNLKQSLAETSSDFEKCKQDLLSKESRVSELENKLKAYMEAGERMEALESELSYIRNSATALRESFLLKDSALQRIEEILEDLELPEHFHSGDLIDKVDWLAKYVSRNSLPLADWDHKTSVVGGSYSEAGIMDAEGWQEEIRPSSSTSDNHQKIYEDLQSRFYGLAEQNAMLEQSLVERNNLVQRWEEILDRIEVPSQLRSIEPEDRIEWLRSALSEAQNHCNSLQEKIDNLETSSALVTTDLQRSEQRTSDLEKAFHLLITEKEALSQNLEILTQDYEEILKKASALEVNNGSLQREVVLLQERLDQKHGCEERVQYFEGGIRRLQDVLRGVLQDSALEEIAHGREGFDYFEGLIMNLLEKHADLSRVVLDKEVLSQNLEILTQDYDEISKKASALEVNNLSLQREIVLLQERLDQKHGCEERVQYFEGGIRRLEDALRGVLQDSDLEEAERHGFDNFEGLIMKLLEKHAELCPAVPDKLDAEQVIENSRDAVEQFKVLEDLKAETINLNKKLDDTIVELFSVKKERNGYMEKNHSLVHEVEAMETKMKNLQDQLSQEEHKSSTIREKLNVAVRKGKSLIQQRDSMKQVIEETNSEIGRLKSVISEYENRTKDLNSLQEKLETLRSENIFLRDSISQNDQAMQEKDHNLSLILKVLGHIDVGLEKDIVDPVEKLENIDKYNKDLQSDLAAMKHESSKSKRAADLLLAELNEVQERNDVLQEELAKISTDLLELSRERDYYYAEAMQVMSNRDQLQKDLSSLGELVLNVLSNDLETLRGLKACIKSCHELGDTPSLLVQLSGNIPTDLISFKSGDQAPTQGIDSLRGQLYRHFELVHEERTGLADILGLIYSELNSQKSSCESMRRDIQRLESVELEKESTLLLVQRNFSLLVDACNTTITEIDNYKTELGARGIGSRESSFTISPKTIEITEDALSFSSEGGTKAIQEKLFSAVKDLMSMQAETSEINLKDVRSTILNLQKELQEKDIQGERNCMELVQQIKEAEAIANKYSQELQISQGHLEDLQREVQGMEEVRNVLERRTKELQDMEAACMEYKGRIQSLTDELAAKGQENEALLQALDEEEIQMEDMRNKVVELESLLQQKDKDLEKLDISRGKALKKLSATVHKFTELRSFSEDIVSEVENLQSQLQDRDQEISFLRQEVTRCTKDALLASQVSNNSSSNEVSELLAWLATMFSKAQAGDSNIGDTRTDEYKEMLKEQIISAVSELEGLRVAVQKGDMLLQIEKAKVEGLTSKEQSLQSHLREKESQLAMIRGDVGQTTTTSPEIVELEPMINKRAAPAAAPQVRSLRKANNEQVSIAIDVDQNHEKLEEDDDKAHGFKSLTTSRIVPRFTRPVTDMVDGLWVSCDRALMRQPALRLGVILYWALLHALLAAYAV